jgi:trans-aconitate methyltransferase
MDPVARFYPSHDRWLAPLLETAGVLPMLERGGAVVELGCGRGRTLAWLAQRFPRCDLLGIDLVATHVDSARELLAGRVVVELGDAATFVPTRGFDVVLFHLALHDMARPEDALRRGLSWRSPGGRVVVVEIAEYFADVDLLARCGLPRANLRVHADEHVLTGFIDAAP